MQTYQPKENALVPFVFPEIIDILRSNIELPSWDIRHDILNGFRTECMNWLMSGDHTKLRGIDRFKNVYLLYGGSQYIDDLCKFESRHIDLHKHEYVAYRTVLSINKLPHSIHDSFNTMGKDPNNLLIVSYPFSLNGNKDQDILNMLELSKSKITLDSVFLGTNLFGVEIDFNKLSNIESFIFSFSKGFGLRYNRIGIMFTDLTIPEYDIYHSYAYHNLYSAQIARKIMKSYPLDYFTTKYKHVQEKACEIVGCNVSDCLHLGSDPQTQNPDKKVRITHLFDKLC